MREPILSPQVGLSPESNLGGEVYDREMLTAFARLGHPIHVLLPEGGLHPDVPNLHVEYAPRCKRYTYEYNLRWTGRIRRMVTDTRPLVLRCHTPYALGFACLRAARRTGTPVVCHYLHLTGERQHHVVDSLVAHCFDALITISEYTRNQILDRYRVDPESIHVVPAGVRLPEPHPERMRQLRQELRLGNSPVILYLGQLSARKNVAAAVEAFGQVRKRVKDAVFVIAGKGPERQRLEQQAREMGVAESVRFAGFVPETDKSGWYALADVFVFPSLLEGFGMAAAEALWCGTPVVASNASAIPEVIRHGETGLLADPRDAAALAENLTCLLADTDLRRRMGETGQAQVRADFDWDRVAARVLDIYREVASKSGS